MKAFGCGYGSRRLIHIIFASILLMTAFSCQTVPVTERQQLHLLPEGQILEMSLSSYQQFLSEHKVVHGTPQARMVADVGGRIRNAVDRYLDQNNLSNRVEGYEWEFNLVEDKAMNAFAMPGGKVVVFTGILPVAQSETGLAVVMGHEIAHVIAAHGNERMSQGLLAQMGGMALSIALAEKPAQTQQLFMAAFGIGAQVGFLLPYSRIQESEADHLGLIFMAMAGYDPHASVDFWQRMSGAQEGGKPPEFLSTHPSDRTRIENLRKLIPEAMDYYTAASHQ
ncbi:MAG: M48 family metallopeptidase [Deltaproteobacteria bacterium]|nr:M48 family metallopeptidase [Deltaproteobacteria bacterium]